MILKTPTVAKEARAQRATFETHVNLIMVSHGLSKAQAQLEAYLQGPSGYGTYVRPAPVETAVPPAK